MRIEPGALDFKEAAARGITYWFVVIILWSFIKGRVHRPHGYILSWTVYTITKTWVVWIREVTDKVNTVRCLSCLSDVVPVFTSSMNLSLSTFKLLCSVDFRLGATSWCSDLMPFQVLHALMCSNRLERDLQQK